MFPWEKSMDILVDICWEIKVGGGFMDIQWLIFLMDHLMEIAIFMEYLRILRDIQWILAILWIPNVWWILLMEFILEWFVQFPLTVILLAFERTFWRWDCWRWGLKTLCSCSMTFGWLDPVEKWEIELHFETCLQRNGISCNSLC